VVVGELVPLPLANVVHLHEDPEPAEEVHGPVDRHQIDPSIPEASMNLGRPHWQVMALEYLKHLLTRCCTPDAPAS
jgi:hypothetical protein